MRFTAYRFWIGTILDLSHNINKIKIKDKYVCFFGFGWIFIFIYLKKRVIK